jgi:hypothetical protein
MTPLFAWSEATAVLFGLAVMSGLDAPAVALVSPGARGLDSSRAMVRPVPGVRTPGTDGIWSGSP